MLNKLNLSNNDSLTHSFLQEGFQSLISLNSLDLYDNESLDSFDFLNSQISLNVLDISGQNITSLSDFSNYISNDTVIYLDFCDNLISLQGLESFNRLGGLYLAFNKNL